MNERRAHAGGHEIVLFHHHIASFNLNSSAEANAKTDEKKN